MNDPKLKKVWLVSFGDSRLQKAKKRLYRQAVEFGLEKEHILILEEKDLDLQFKKLFSEHLVLGSRGYGYMCWKPEVCLETFRKMQDGDILLYMDIGNHLRKKGKSRIYDYLHNVEAQDFLAFQYRSFLSTTVPDPRHHFNLVSYHTKGDMLDYYGVRDNQRILNSGQMITAAFFMKKCEEAIAFCEKWKKVYCDDFSLNDDSPSKSKNIHARCLHRHDQSSFSIMWLLKGLPTVSACEIEHCRRRTPAPPEYRHDPMWGHAWFYQMSAYPIQARRDKGQVSFPRRVYRYLKYRHVMPLFRKILGR